MIRRARYRHLITIKRKSDTQNAYGAKSKKKTDLVDVHPVSCNVQVISGTELIKNGVNYPTRLVSVLMDVDTEMKEDRFFTWEDEQETYSVLSIKPTNKERQYIVSAERI